MHHHIQCVEHWKDVAIGLFTGIRSLKTPGPGAVAHMSLHQKPTMSKSRSTMLRGTAFVPPICTGGTGCLSMLATVAVGGGSRQRRVGEVHLGGVPDSVNGFLQFCFAEVEKWQNSPVFRANFFRPISPPRWGSPANPAKNDIPASDSRPFFGETGRLRTDESVKRVPLKP